MVLLELEHSLHLHQADLAEMAGQGVPPSGAPVVVAVARTLLAVMAAHLVALAVLVAAGRRMTYPAHPEAMPVVAVAAGMTMAPVAHPRKGGAPVARVRVQKVQMAPMLRQILAAVAEGQDRKGWRAAIITAGSAALAS
jgi:hypothetical protein